jgi:hypothetical protein
MASITIKMTGYVQALDKVKLLGAGAAAANGPLVTLGSRLPYARRIELPGWRRAGGAFMFLTGIKAAAEVGRTDLPGAIIRGPAAVGATKRKMRDRGVMVTRANTPVRSGKLRASVSELNRPGIV